MTRSLIQAALLTLVLWVCAHYWPWRDLRYGPGIAIAPAEPIQNAVQPYSLGQLAGYELTALAEYDITARVLHTRRYRWENGSDLAPLDLAVGWGRMSDEAALDRLTLSQGFRFYFYEWKGQPPLPREEMIAHSANMHIIPADAAVRKEVFSLRTGSLVHLHGSLVNARSREGRTWSSSLSRTDSGPGACELFCVDSVELPVVVSSGKATAAR